MVTLRCLYFVKKALVLLLISYTLAIHAADYQQGQAKAAECAACHGTHGISANPLWPNLAGQHKRYVIKQLIDFKHHAKRPSDIMTPIANLLNNADIANLALFYSNLPLPAGKTPQQYLKRGEQLYRGGDMDKHITACIACHSPKGTGNEEAGFPVLSGQQAAYTIQQLHAFKDKKRHNDLNAIMQDISARMSNDDIDAVAYYVSSLH